MISTRTSLLVAMSTSSANAAAVVDAVAEADVLVAAAAVVATTEVGAAGAAVDVAAMIEVAAIAIGDPSRLSPTMRRFWYPALRPTCPR